jgi:hypothetical protein
LTTKGSGSCGSVPDLHHDAAALGRRHAGLERVEVARDFVGDVELRILERVGFAVGAQRHVRADDLACDNGRSSTSVTVILRAPASRAASTVTQPIVPGARDQHRLAEEVAAAIHAVQAHGERLGERELAERDVAVHGIALALAHHEVVLEHALHVREAARTAEEAHAVAQVLAAFAAILAASARMRRRYRDLVAHLDPRDAFADARDHRGCLVARNERLADHEVAVAPFEIIVEVRSANAGGPQAEQHFTGPGDGVSTGSMRRSSLA